MAAIPQNGECGAEIGGLAAGEAVKASLPRINSHDRLSQPARVVLVDDEESVHQLFERVFKRHAPAWSLDGYYDAAVALERILRRPPDAVVMDIAMPGISGIECARRLKSRLPDVPVVMLSAYVNTETVFESMMAGACGCMRKPVQSGEFLAALQKAMTGSLTFCSHAEQVLLECFANMGKNVNQGLLTPREKQILTGLCQNKSDKQIGKMLGIGAGTVHVHVSSIFKKLNVHSRAEVVGKMLNPGRDADENGPARGSAD